MVEALTLCILLTAGCLGLALWAATLKADNAALVAENATLRAEGATDHDIITSLKAQIAEKA